MQERLHRLELLSACARLPVCHHCCVGIICADYPEGLPFSRCDGNGCLNASGNNLVVTGYCVLLVSLRLYTIDVDSWHLVYNKARV